ncbi:hypothetical protein SERLA73DRAFT_60134, partial [Serpula lacrymans var. lacrymans S7.3]
LLVTKNLVPGESVYGEKRISIEGAEDTKTEYRVWNPFRSKLAAGVLGGLDSIYIAPGKKVLYLGAASGTSVSHVADIVGPEGVVYAVEFSPRSGRDLINMAKKRTNVIPIVEDARLPNKYRMLLSTVDVIFADVAQPDQARIVIHNAQYFLKDGGHIVISIKASCIDSTVAPATVFVQEVQLLREGKFKPIEQITLEPYERDHAMVSGKSAYWRIAYKSFTSSLSMQLNTNAICKIGDPFVLFIFGLRCWIFHSWSCSLRWLSCRCRCLRLLHRLSSRKVLSLLSVVNENICI